METGGQKPRMILQYNTPSLTGYGGQNAPSTQKIICSGWGIQVESGNNKPIVTHRDLGLTATSGAETVGLAFERSRALRSEKHSDRVVVLRSTYEVT